MKKTYFKPEIENIGAMPDGMMLPTSVDGESNKLPYIQSEWAMRNEEPSSVNLDISLDNRMWDE